MVTKAKPFAHEYAHYICQTPFLMIESVAVLLQRFLFFLSSAGGFSPPFLYKGKSRKRYGKNRVKGLTK